MKSRINGSDKQMPRTYYGDPIPRSTGPHPDQLADDLEARLLPEMPPHWHIASIAVRRDRAWAHGQGDLTYDALLERDGGDYEATGSGPTPAAAVRAAMKEIG